MNYRVDHAVVETFLIKSCERMSRLRPPSCLSISAVVLAVITIAAAPAIAVDRPNIVFVLADDLGWSELGCYCPSPAILYNPFGWWDQQAGPPKWGI